MCAGTSSTELVVTPVLRPTAEDRPGPTPYGDDGRYHAAERPAGPTGGSLSLGRVREVLRRQVEVRRREGDQLLHLLEGTDLFGPGDVRDLPDGLHPNAAGYRRMARRFLPKAFGDQGVLRVPLAAGQ